MSRVSSTLLLCLAAGSALLHGQAQLAGQVMLVPGSGLQAGGSSAFSIGFQAAPEPIAGLQIDVRFDASVFSLFPSAGDATRQSDKSIYVQDVGPGLKRIVITGLNQGPMFGGTLVDVLVTTSKNASASNIGGGYIYLASVSAVYGNGAAAPITASDTALQVVAGSSELLVPNGVQNGASFRPSAVSPGEIMTLRAAGIGPAQATLPSGAVANFVLGGMRVNFDGLPAPLLYAGPDQLNVIAPTGVSGKPSTTIAVTRDGQPVASATVGVAAVTPAIFALDPAGTGAGAVLNQDMSVNSPLNPARAGSVISIFGTGIGLTQPLGIDGAVAGTGQASAAVLATVGGMPAQVSYAGPAPGLVSGVFQVNCRVPDGIGPGLSIEVIVSVGGVRTLPGITIAVAAP